MSILLEANYFSNIGNVISNYFRQIEGLYSTFSLIDLIDILFVAFCLFIIIRIIRETRAMQLIGGFVLLAVFYGIVNLFGMNASSFIMKTIFGNILLIAVILFGPEIRNILEQVGKGATRKSLKSIMQSGGTLETAEIENCIDATCKACVDLADNKIGALIVFENETLLGDIVKSGTIINAKTTKELIENIFYPKAALHDGAMVISKGKIHAAGCILPLTNDINISSALGTRHRAAIGLSEQSDSIIFVVSEETGAISVAQNGVLTRDISSGDMRDILTSTLLPNYNSSNNKGFTNIVRRIKK